MLPYSRIDRHVNNCRATGLRCSHEFFSRRLDGLSWRSTPEEASETFGTMAPRALIGDSSGRFVEDLCECVDEPRDRLLLVGIGGATRPGHLDGDGGSRLDAERIPAQGKVLRHHPSPVDDQNDPRGVFRRLPAQPLGTVGVECAARYELVEVHDSTVAVDEPCRPVSEGLGSPDAGSTAMTSGLSHSTRLSGHDRCDHHSR